MVRDSNVTMTHSTVYVALEVKMRVQTVEAFGYIWDV